MGVYAGHLLGDRYIQDVVEKGEIVITDGSQCERCRPVRSTIVIMSRAIPLHVFVAKNRQIKFPERYCFLAAHQSSVKKKRAGPTTWFYVGSVYVMQ